MFTMRLITQINRAFILKRCLAVQTFRKIKTVRHDPHSFCMICCILNSYFYQIFFIFFIFSFKTNSDFPGLSKQKQKK